jgi:hypothetical protein
MEDIKEPLDDMKIDDTPLTKAKKKIPPRTPAQLESLKKGRESAAKKREIKAAEKVLHANEILQKHKQSIPEPELKIEPSITYQIEDQKQKEERKSKKALPALQIPEPDIESEEEVEIIYKKRPKKKKIIKYISDSESEDDSPPPSPPPQKQKGLMKPERSAQNKKQLRPSGVSIFCD